MAPVHVETLSTSITECPGDRAPANEDTTILGSPLSHPCSLEGVSEPQPSLPAAGCLLGI